MLSETFQVVSIIEKPPPACKDFKNYLKHMRNEMSIEDLIIRLHIEEDNRGSEKKGAHNPSEAKANFVEHGQYYKFKKANNKGKATSLDLRRNFSAEVSREMLQLWEVRSQILILQTTKEKQT